MLDVPPELESAARTISAANPEGRGERWIPHITMGLRIPRSLVPAYIAALDDAALTAAQAAASGRATFNLRDFTIERAAYWKPREKQERTF